MKKMKGTKLVCLPVCLSVCLFLCVHCLRVCVCVHAHVHCACLPVVYDIFSISTHQVTSCSICRRVRSDGWQVRHPPAPHLLHSPRQKRPARLLPELCSGQTWGWAQTTLARYSQVSNCARPHDFVFAWLTYFCRNCHVVMLNCWHESALKTFLSDSISDKDKHCLELAN